MRLEGENSKPFIDIEWLESFFVQFSHYRYILLFIACFSVLSFPVEHSTQFYSTVVEEIK